MCLYPILIKNPKYIPNKKNGYNPPQYTDKRTLLVPVGCGYCIECRKQKSREWQIRLQEEIKDKINMTFVTLTFSEEELKKLKDESVNLQIHNKEENEIATIAVRRFLERWRKKYKKSIKHWLITELGHENTERIHLHGILFTNKIDEIAKIWQYGYIWTGEYVNNKTINYIVKYITKLDKDHPNYKPKILCSKGIGSNYFNRIDHKNNRFNNENTIEYYQTPNGGKLSLPTYYRNKLYTDEQKEQLWIHKLNKNERWIMGQKIDISKSEDGYFEILKQMQKKNLRLGYGKLIDWEIDQYKRDRKKLKHINKHK